MKKDNGKATATTVASKVVHIPYMNILPKVSSLVNNLVGETATDRVMTGLFVATMIALELVVIFR